MYVKWVLTRIIFVLWQFILFLWVLSFSLSFSSAPPPPSEEKKVFSFLIFLHFSHSFSHSLSFCLSLYFIIIVISLIQRKKYIQKKIYIKLFGQTYTQEDMKTEIQYWKILKYTEIKKNHHHSDRNSTHALNENYFKKKSKLI